MSPEYVLDSTAAIRRRNGALIDAFHQVFYHAPCTWLLTTWCGVPMMKCAFDVVMYQELLYRVRPDLVIETGTAFGGSAMFLCDALSALKIPARVITVELNPRYVKPQRRQLTCLVGSSTELKIVAEIGRRVKRAHRVMVILDSDHSCAHVAREMELYAPFVTVDSYLIVEDTNIGHPVVKVGLPPRGPYGAVETFLASHPEFKVDLSCERNLITFNPNGYLRRVKA